jgi:hypothetical protein
VEAPAPAPGDPFVTGLTRFPWPVDCFEDLPGKWQAAMLKAEQNRPKLRVVSGA